MFGFSMDTPPVRMLPPRYKGLPAALEAAVGGGVLGMLPAAVLLPAIFPPPYPFPIPNGEVAVASTFAFPLPLS